MSEHKLTLLTVSSLEKIFPDEPFHPQTAYTGASCLLNERFSFQTAYYWEGPLTFHARVVVSGSLAGAVTVRQVGLAPSELPIFPDGDNFLLRNTPGLYPDPLYPGTEDITLLPGQWRSLWITVPAECSLPAGSYELTVSILGEDGTVLGCCGFQLERLNALLPEQTLIHTEWFHTDCIADWYKIPVFSEEYWELTFQYMEAAARYGINMILTPLFTPPLDTAPGGERTTVQLIDVYRDENGYTFSFEKLERWLALCERCHICYLEFSHLFTQWGAGHAPKIMAMEGSPLQKMAAPLPGRDLRPVKRDVSNRFSAGIPTRRVMRTGNSWKRSCPVLWILYAAISYRNAAISMYLMNRIKSIFLPICMPKVFWSLRLTVFLSWMPCLIMNSTSRAL